MHRFTLSFALLTFAVGAAVVPACSSSQAASSGTDAGGDSAIAPGALVGAPCDPTLADPCLQVICSEVSCNPITQTCTSTPLPGPCQLDAGSSFDFEAGADTGTTVSSGCNSDNDCPPIPPNVDGGSPIPEVCAFSVIDGCQATGNCVTPEVPHLADGAVELACGCDGQPVPYVTDDQTSAPVQTGVPCTALGGADAGVDAGADASDSGTDAGDAADDAPTDG